MGDREACVPRARAAVERAPSAPADLAVASVRRRLAAFLHELTTVPGSPQIAVLRDRAEALDRAVAAPLLDPEEIQDRWARFDDALTRFCPPGTAGHDVGVDAIASSLTPVR